MSESEQPGTRRRDDVTDVEMVGGVEKRDLFLLDYDPDWARQFAEHEARIREALSGTDFGVEHKPDLVVLRPCSSLRRQPPCRASA